MILAKKMDSDSDCTFVSDTNQRKYMIDHIKKQIKLHKKRTKLLSTLEIQMYLQQIGSLSYHRNLEIQELYGDLHGLLNTTAQSQKYNLRSQKEADIFDLTEDFNFLNKDSKQQMKPQVEVESFPMDFITNQDFVFSKSENDSSQASIILMDSNEGGGKSEIDEINYILNNSIKNDHQYAKKFDEEQTKSTMDQIVPPGEETKTVPSTNEEHFQVINEIIPETELDGTSIYQPEDNNIENQEEETIPTVTVEQVSEDLFAENENLGQKRKSDECDANDWDLKKLKITDEKETYYDDTDVHFDNIQLEQLKEMLAIGKENADKAYEDLYKICSTVQAESVGDESELSHGGRSLENDSFLNEMIHEVTHELRILESKFE